MSDYVDCLRLMTKSIIAGLLKAGCVTVAQNDPCLVH